MKRILRLACTILLLWTAVLSAAEPVDPSEKHPEVNLIPWPKTLELGEGKMRLGPSARIAAEQVQLRPLAEILASEFFTAAGIRAEVVSGAGQAGDVVLRIDAGLKADEPIRTIRDRELTQTTDGAHAIVVTDRATVTGFDYRAVAEGTATLLQAISRDNAGLYLPAVRIKDWPHADYCAAMLDVGRQDHPVESIKQFIELCRVYKVRYLHLHLTDDQGWTFPSTKYPRLGTQNFGAHGGKAPRVYKLEELKDAVAYGDARGVALVPEFEMPGHSGAARRCMPEVFCAIRPKTGKPVDIGCINLANEDLYPVLDTLIGEMCDVFRSSPYFHIGTDECQTNGLPVHAGFKAFLAKRGLKDEEDVTRYFIQEVNAMIARRGKRTIKWEGVGDEACKDVICMCWVGSNRTAERMVKGGFTVITCPWDLGIPWPQWSMYFCNGSTLKRSDPVIGANVVLWEQTPARHLCMARRALPERQERTWGPDNQFTENGFARRWNGADALAAKLAGLNEPKYPAAVSASLPGVGLIDPIRALDAPRRSWQDESGEMTWFQSCRAPRSGDHLTVRFDQPLAVYDLVVTTGHKNQYRLGRGELQTSADGQAFKTVANFQDGTARATVEDSAVKAVRIRATAPQDDALAVDDIKLSLMSPVSGTVKDPYAIGVGNYAVCTGDTTIPNLGDCRVNFLNKGFTLTIGTGGGNASALEGVLGGAGNVEFQAGPHASGFRDSPLALTGDRPNTLAGVCRVKQGRLALSKRDGIVALAGKIIVGGQGSNDGLSWTNNEQIDDGASVELLDSPQGGAYLDLSGHTEKFDSLAMAPHTRVLTGGGILRVNRLTVEGREMPAGIYTGGDAWCRGPGMVLVGGVPQREVSGPIDATAGRPSVAVLKGPATLRLNTDSADVFRTEAFTLSLEADGKKALRFSGFIAGNGNLTIAAAAAKSPPGEALTLCGPNANSYRGPTHLAHGILRLAKPAGVTAIPGDLVLGGSALENRGDAVVWAADEQVADESTITLDGNQPCSLDLDGHKESLLRLVLSGAAKVRTGPGGQLKVKLLSVAGKPVSPGTYTASAGWIEGGGTVVIDPRVEVAGNAGVLAPGLVADLTGDALFGWGHLAFDVRTNGHTARFDSGDGNATTVFGSISGTGNVKFTMGPFHTGFRDAPMVLAGDQPNTASGTYYVAKGRVQLQKPEGVDAIAGNVIVGGQGYNDCLRWEKSEQVKDSATITLIESPANGAGYLDLNGCTETAAALTITANNKVKTDGPGGKGGVLKVRALTVGGAGKPAGTYTVANAPWIEGGGKVLVQP